MSRKTLSRKVDALTELVRSIEDDHYPSDGDYIQALRMIAETAQSALPNAVDSARANGVSWDQIGRYLGTTRQAAWERFGKS
jgi:hypothetical protein